MPLRRVVPLFLALAPSLASAICVESVPARDIKTYPVVLVATITSATLRGPISDLKSRRPYRVDYTFEVIETYKGKKSDVTSLFSIELYHDPKERHWVMAESVDFVPGDTVLIVAEQPGEVQLAFCGPATRVDLATKDLKDLRSGP